MAGLSNQLQLTTRKLLCTILTALEVSYNLLLKNAGITHFEKEN